MKQLVVHITFFYLQNRKKYLEEVIDNLLTINNIDIFIHTNRQFILQKYKQYNNIKVIVHNLNYQNPFYLTWKSRKYFKDQLNQYQFYMYIQDDIKFNIDNFNYYLKYYKMCNQLNYNCGFIRIQYNNCTNSWYLCDIYKELQNTELIKNNTFIINDNSPYQALWLVDNLQLEKFIKNQNLFNFKQLTYNNGFEMIRQNSSIGPIIKMYKKSVFKNEKGAFVHHIPNNYVLNPKTPCGKIKIETLEKLK